jgi:hypothetical protein
MSAVLMDVVTRVQAYRERPDAIALTSPDGQLSYEQLWLQALALAGNLNDVGVRRGDPVALCLPRSIELIVGDGDLSRRFFDAAARLVGPIWAANQFNDLYMCTENGQPSVSEELRQLREEVLTAAETSSVFTERLFRSMNLIDPPADYSPLLGSPESELQSPSSNLLSTRRLVL